LVQIKQDSSKHAREEKMAQTHKIDIVAMAFPGDTPVGVGDTVVWTNKMNMSHTVTADDGSFDSGVLGRDQPFSHTFDTVGSVDYHCEIHPNMIGKVTVAAAGKGKTHTIEITSKAFPADTQVAVGDTVTWINRMNMGHTVTADDGSFDSGVFGKDQSFSNKFTAAGTFTYQCLIHGEMTGQITVS
jgi:plastocyanin